MNDVRIITPTNEGLPWPYLLRESPILQRPKVLLHALSLHKSCCFAFRAACSSDAALPAHASGTYTTSRLTSLPSGIGKLQELEVLASDHNLLTSVPGVCLVRS